jgi:hypothetical protein
MLKQKELTMNLFEFVKDLTVVNDNVLPDLQVLLENVGYDGNAYLYPQQIGRAVRPIGENQ